MNKAKVEVMSGTHNPSNEQTEGTNAGVGQEDGSGAGHGDGEGECQSAKPGMSVASTSGVSGQVLPPSTNVEVAPGDEPDGEKTDDSTQSYFFFGSSPESADSPDPPAPEMGNDEQKSTETFSNVTLRKGKRKYSEVD